MKALVLAAGKGTRLAPYTDDRPKVLIDIAGKPFLYYVLNNLKKAGITDIGIIVGYMKDMVKKFVDEEGFKVTFIEQKDQHGTGHAVMTAKEWIGKEDFILLMGDNLYSEKDIAILSKMKDEFIHIAAFKSNHPQDYGVLETDGHTLIKIHEKPSQPKNNLVNTGLYKLKAKILDTLVRIKRSPRGELELTDAITNLANYGDVKVYEIKDYWIDMSVKEDIPKIEEEIKKLGL